MYPSSSSRGQGTVSKAATERENREPTSEYFSVSTITTFHGRADWARYKRCGNSQKGSVHNHCYVGASIIVFLPMTLYAPTICLALYGDAVAYMYCPHPF